MTSESNKLLPILTPQETIGTKRRPNPRDLKEREITHDLPDPDSEVVLRRAALNLEQAALKIQQAIIDVQPESSMRESLTVLADAEGDSPSNSDWETLSPSSPEMDNEEQQDMENAMIAKVRGEEVGKVKAVRAAAPVRIDIPDFFKKVRAVKERAAKRTAATPVAPPPLPPGAPASGRAPAPALNPTTMQPGTTIELTVAQAALALTNSQTGTDVTMEDLKTVIEIEDNQDTYKWTIGGDDVRELTVAEAALILTNMQTGTDLTMQDLRTAREMVDLWDNEDVYPWVVGILP